MNNPKLNEVGERIRKVREEAKLTQGELGKKIKISAMGISYLEKGLRKIKLEDVVKIADALEIDKSFLLEPITKVSPYQNTSSSMSNFRSEDGLSEATQREAERKIEDLFRELEDKND